MLFDLGYGRKAGVKMHTSLKAMKDKELISYLEKMVDLERKNAAKLVEILREVDSRRLFLKLGFSSFFAYLTEGLGYSPASAQRRIDAARLSREIPEIKEDIARGDLNFTQISILTQGLRQKKKENAIQGSTDRAFTTPISTELKKQILMQIKNKDLKTTQHVVSEKLDLPVLTLEKERIQKDSSTRLEMTFTAQQMKDLERVKQLVSHKHPNLGWAELIVLLAEDHLKRKDPLRKVASSAFEDNKNLESSSNFSGNAVENSEMGIGARDAVKDSEIRIGVRGSSKDSKVQNDTNGAIKNTKAQIKNNINKLAKVQKPKTAQKNPNSTSDSEVKNPRSIPATTRRLVFQRDKGICQWKDPQTKKLCRSQFQLQIDHKTSIWAGGSSAPQNLQLLCSVHNQLKYQMEAGICRKP